MKKVKQNGDSSFLLGELSANVSTCLNEIRDTRADTKEAIATIAKNLDTHVTDDKQLFKELWQELNDLQRGKWWFLGVAAAVLLMAELIIRLIPLFHF